MTDERPVPSRPRRGWSSADLAVVATDDVHYWSVADAATLLGPPTLSQAQVRNLVHLAGLQPKGKRYNGARRRHVRVYDATELIEAFDRLASYSE
jgi:hypothetical protein